MAKFFEKVRDLLGTPKPAAAVPVPSRAEVKAVEGPEEWKPPVRERRKGLKDDGLNYFAPVGARELPDGQHVVGSMAVQVCPRLKKLGQGLRVDKDLIIGGYGPTHELRRTTLLELPEGLRVGGSLELRACFLLERFPQDFWVGGSVLIADCDVLKELPAGMRVTGDLTIVGGGSLENLPEKLMVDGNFRLAGTQVRRLPEGIVVGGSLIIEGRSRMEELPKGLIVGGDLVLRGSRVTRIPEGLGVGRDLVLRGCDGLVELPAGLRIPRHLTIADCGKLVRLPGDLQVMGNMRAARCMELEALPEDLIVHGGLDLRGCGRLAAIPGSVQIGMKLSDTVRSRLFRRTTPALCVAGCEALLELPPDLAARGPIDVAGSGLTDLPAPWASQGVLWRGVRVDGDVVFHPERLVPRRILDEPNAEIRRVMIERLGIETVLAKNQALTVQSDSDAGGERRLVHVPGVGRFLLCACPSTRRQYLLRVPGTMSTCHQAAAWLAGFDDPARYKPELET